MDSTSNVISLNAVRSEIVSSHDFFMRRDFIAFLGEEISLENKPGAADADCTFTMTLAGLRHFRRMFSAYGLGFDNLRTYGELRAHYWYIYELACELARWHRASDTHRAHYRRLAAEEDAEQAQVLEALFANDVASARRLHSNYNTPARILREYSEESSQKG